MRAFLPLVAIAFTALSGLISGPSAAADAARTTDASDPRVTIAAKIPGVKPEDLKATPINGIYELARGTDVAYVSSDGKYAISGDLYNIASNDNMTEARRRDARLKLLAAVPESEMVVFSPKNPKYTVTVFTDVDCQYCRKLHSQIADYERLGIRVRYLFYPRTGPNTLSWKKADEVWCSADRAEALTRAKRGENLPDKSCSGSPVARHYALGQEFGLQGTPAIVLPDGEFLSGYLPPQMLMQQIQAGGRGG
jgi:thiol:disulfide interchange protein DsbC